MKRPLVLLLALAGILGGVGLAEACSGGFWNEDQSLSVGDAGLKAPLRFNFNSEFEEVFGRPSAMAKSYREDPANRSQVIGEVLQLLADEMRKDGGEQADERAQAIAKVLAEATEERPQVDAAKLKPLLEGLPKEFALYFESLTMPREEALAATQRLLDLKPWERANLTALAHYRKARLMTLTTAWPGQDPEATKRRLQEIRRAYRAAIVEAEKGAPDIARLSRAAEGWIAHSRSLILPFPELVELEEADAAMALRTYLELWNKGETMGRNSAYQLVRSLAAESRGMRACAQDSQLRQLMTLYLCSGGQRKNGEYSEKTGAANVENWLSNLEMEGVEPREDAVRIANLQYLAGRYAECEALLRYCPEDDPAAALLRSRMELRLGRRDVARRELSAVIPWMPDEALPPNWGTEDFGWERAPKLEFYLDRTMRSSIHGKVRAELALLELAAGRYEEALRLNLRAGLIADARYIGECVLSIEELKAFVDRECMKPLMAMRRAYEDDESYRQDVNGELRDLLASRLCRANRWEEATPYARENQVAGIREHVRLMALAEDETRPAAERADAYWRAAVNLWGGTGWLLRCEFGPSWTHHAGWEMGSWPVSRTRPTQDNPWQPISGPGEDERARLEAWIAANLVTPNLGHRIIKYEVLRLTLKAAALLPDNHVGGSRILQFAGSEMMYLDPKTANAAYKLLATRFKETEYGRYAFEKRWFKRPESEQKPDEGWVGAAKNSDERIQMKEGQEEKGSGERGAGSGK